MRSSVPTRSSMVRRRDDEREHHDAKLHQGGRCVSRSDQYLELLRQRTLVFDGAMGTQIQDAELTAGDFGGKEGANDYLTLTRGDFIRDIHRAYLEAGADVVETNSFQATSLKLEEWGLED